MNGRPARRSPGRIVDLNQQADAWENGAPERKERRKSIPFNFNDLGQF